MIDFRDYILSADDFGHLILYKEEYGEEVTLGEINEEGSFQSAWWLKEGSEIIPELREVLQAQYFGEVKAGIAREQAEWPERYLKFMQLQNEDRKKYQNLEKLSSENSNSLGEGRYLTGNDEVLNGVYVEDICEKKQYRVFNFGKLIYQFTLQKYKHESNVGNFDSLHLLNLYSWLYAPKQKPNLNILQLNLILEGKVYLAEFFCQNESFLKSRLNQLENAGLYYWVYPHQELAECYRVVAATNEISKVLENQEEALNAYKTYAESILENHEKGVEFKELILNQLNSTKLKSEFSPDNETFFVFEAGFNFTALYLKKIPFEVMFHYHEYLINQKGEGNDHNLKEASDQQE